MACSQWNLWANSEQAYIKNLGFIAATPSAFAVRLYGVAGFGIDDVSINGGNYVFKYGLQLSGSQQGYVHRGTKCKRRSRHISRRFGRYVSSNGVDISGGRTFLSWDSCDRNTGRGDQPYGCTIYILLNPITASSSTKIMAKVDGDRIYLNSH